MPLLPILCYHKVGPPAREGRRLNIAPERLRSHVRFFRRRGSEIVLPRDLAHLWPGRGACFTFDDAYESTLNAVPEIFLSEGVRCAFYAVTHLVGRTSEWDGEAASPLAEWSALQTAAAEGFEIGNHTPNHPRLAELAPADQEAAIREARDALSAQGVGAGSMCYPYGSWNQETLAAAAACGYEVGVILGKRPASSKDPRLALPRIPVACSDALPKLLYKIHVRHRLP